MEVSIQSLVYLAAVILTGLSAGLFCAWSVSVIPGTQALSDHTYLQTMQSINRAILNPAFFFIFFGSIFFLSIASIYQFNSNKITFWLMLASSIFYLVGTIGVTALGNVPLNDQLDVMKLGEIASDRIEAFRAFYETNWNRLHLIRTVFAFASFVLAVFAFFTYSKSQL